MPEDIASPPAAKAPPPDEITPDPPMSGADPADVYKDFDAADQAENNPPPPPPKKESAERPPRASAPAKSAATESERDSEEDTLRKAKAASSASNAGSAADKDKASKEVSDEEYARMSKTDRVAFNKSLREENRRLNQALSSLKQEHEKAASAKPDEGRLKETQELLDATRAELKQAQEHLRLTAYERSDEFKKKFQEPIADVWGQGREEAASLKVIQRVDEATGEVRQQARQGTQEDFDRLMGIGSNAEAQAMARQLFGEDANLVMAHRQEILRIQRNSRRELEERRGSAEKIAREQAEAQKRQAEEAETKQRERNEALRREIDAGLKANPEWFKVEEGDDVGAGIVEAGKLAADSLFSGINPRTKQPYTPMGMTRLLAFARNALAAHGPLIHQLSSLKSKVASLEAELSEFKESATLQDAGRKGEETGRGGGMDLAGPEEFYEAEKRSR